jgi:RND family efflux transporter MFP subunit
LQQYEQVTAPFNGVITARNVDVGTLISAQGTGQGSSPGSAGTTQAGAEGINSGASGSLSSSVAPTTGGSQGGEMFAIAALDPLRILVSVPEAYASLIQLGQHADLAFQEKPQQKVQGTVARTSSSIDQNTRTLLVEVQARNPAGRLLPGMYVVANFSHLKGDSLLIPGESIVVRNAQSMVATVENNHVQFRPIQIGRDYGDQVEITSGLQPGDVIARIVTDQVQNGVEIQPQFQK